eukprot:TRINITY_DN13520_c0_g1_i1.p1 TRINITY_DN13520_c0_g1~~TRINITY_DN13520_c0_g1_i1.p1  ORF type:complete len:1017 (+),score=189.43 TRINITY_DN13520_c0_g1_i1:87-3053(+)
MVRWPWQKKKEQPPEKEEPIKQQPLPQTQRQQQHTGDAPHPPRRQPSQAGAAAAAAPPTAAAGGAAPRRPRGSTTKRPRASSSATALAAEQPAAPDAPEAAGVAPRARRVGSTARRRGGSRAPAPSTPLPPAPVSPTSQSGVIERQRAEQDARHRWRLGSILEKREPLADLRASRVADNTEKVSGLLLEICGKYTFDAKGFGGFVFACGAFVLEDDIAVVEGIVVVGTRRLVHVDLSGHEVVKMSLPAEIKPVDRPEVHWYQDVGFLGVQYGDDHEPLRFLPTLLSDAPGAPPQRLPLAEMLARALVLLRGAHGEDLLDFPHSGSRELLPEYDALCHARDLHTACVKLSPKQPPSPARSASPPERRRFVLEQEATLCLLLGADECQERDGIEDAEEEERGNLEPVCAEGAQAASARERRRRASEARLTAAAKEADARQEAARQLELQTEAELAALEAEELAALKERQAELAQQRQQEEDAVAPQGRASPRRRSTVIWRDIFSSAASAAAAGATLIAAAAAAADAAPQRPPQRRRDTARRRDGAAALQRSEAVAEELLRCAEEDRRRAAEERRTAEALRRGEQELRRQAAAEWAAARRAREQSEQQERERSLSQRAEAAQRALALAEGHLCAAEASARRRLARDEHDERRSVCGSVHAQRLALLVSKVESRALSTLRGCSEAAAAAASPPQPLPAPQSQLTPPGDYASYSWAPAWEPCRDWQHPAADAYGAPVVRRSPRCSGVRSTSRRRGEWGTRWAATALSPSPRVRRSRRRGGSSCRPAPRPRSASRRAWAAAGPCSPCTPPCPGSGPRARASEQEWPSHLSGPEHADCCSWRLHDSGDSPAAPPPPLGPSQAGGGWGSTRASQFTAPSPPREADQLWHAGQLQEPAWEPQPCTSPPVSPPPVRHCSPPPDPHQGFADRLQLLENEAAALSSALCARDYDIAQAQRHSEILRRRAERLERLNAELRGPQLPPPPPPPALLRRSYSP